jgi:hypothetical protein
MGAESPFRATGRSAARSRPTHHAPHARRQDFNRQACSHASRCACCGRQARKNRQRGPDASGCSSHRCRRASESQTQQRAARPGAAQEVVV